MVATDDKRCVALGERLGNFVGQLATDGLRLGEKLRVPAGQRGLWITDVGPRRVDIASVERGDPRRAELCIETGIPNADGPIVTPRLFTP